jgi:hypothetical protein
MYICQRNDEKKKKDDSINECDVDGKTKDDRFKEKHS